MAKERAKVLQPQPLRVVPRVLLKVLAPKVLAVAALRVRSRAAMAREMARDLTVRRSIQDSQTNRTTVVAVATHRRTTVEASFRRVIHSRETRTDANWGRDTTKI